MSGFPRFKLNSTDAAEAAKPANSANPIDQPVKISKISSISSHKPFQRTRVATHAEIMTIPLRPCAWCRRYSFQSGYCEYYNRRLPEPLRECRCVYFEKRT